VDSIGEDLIKFIEAHRVDIKRLFLQKKFDFFEGVIKAGDSVSVVGVVEKEKGSIEPGATRYHMKNPKGKTMIIINREQIDIEWAC
jgi:hypothetical protein